MYYTQLIAQLWAPPVRWIGFSMPALTTGSCHTPAKDQLLTITSAR